MIEQFQQYLDKRCKIEWDTRGFDESSGAVFFDPEKLGSDARDMLELTTASFADRMGELTPFALLLDLADVDEVNEGSDPGDEFLVVTAMGMLADMLFLDQTTGNVMISKRGKLSKHADALSDLKVSVV